MDNNVFFRWIWRINGLLLLISVLLVGGLISYELLRGFLREAPEERVVVNVAEDPAGTEKWVLGRMDGLHGTPYVMVRLISENDQVEQGRHRYIGSGSGYRFTNPGRAKNVLFVDTERNQAHWLFPDNGQIISDVERFPLQGYSEATAKDAKVVFYEIVENDTNGDGVKNTDDKLILAVSRPDGHEFTVLLQNFDWMIGKDLSGDDQAIIIYQLDGVAYSMLLDLSTLKVISTIELPKVDNS